MEGHVPENHSEPARISALLPQTASPTQLLTVTTFFTHRSLHPRHHSQPLPHMGGYCYSHFTDKETETRVVRSMAGKLEESESIARPAWSTWRHPQPVKWCSKADLAVPIFQMGHLEAQREAEGSQRTSRGAGVQRRNNESCPSPP